MNKLAIAGGAAAALVVAAAVAAPYWTGQVAEEQIRAFAAQSEAQYGMPLEVTSFERGYASSTAVTTSRFDTADAAFELVIDHVIDHGPKLGQAAVARIESKLRTPEGTPPELIAALGDRQLVETVTLVQADKTITVDGTVADFDAEVEGPEGKGRIDFGGMQFAVTGSAGGESVRYSMDMAPANFKQGASTVTMGRMTLEGDGRASGIPTLFLGPATGRIESFAVRDDAVAVDMNGLTLDVNFTESDAGFDLLVGYGIDSVLAQGEEAEDIEFVLRFAGLDRQAMAEYTKAAQAFNGVSMAVPAGDAEAAAALDAANARMVQAGIDLMTTGNPTLHVEALNGKYRGGSMQTRAQVRYAGNGDMAAFNPMADLEASLDLQATENMVIAIAGEVLGRRTYGRPPAELSEDERAAINGATRFQLAELMRSGMVEQAPDGAYRVRAVLERGGVLVNDAPTPFLPPPQPQ